MHVVFILMLSFALLVPAAFAADAESLYNKGRAYEEGMDVPQNYTTAHNLFQQAANMNHAEAWHSLGQLYTGGYGFGQDFPKALEYFTKAAELGSKPALASIEGMRLRGYAMPQDSETALEALERMVEEGNTTAMLILSSEYIAGEVLAENLPLAWELVNKALPDKTLNIQLEEVPFYDMENLPAVYDKAKFRAKLKEWAERGNVETRVMLAMDDLLYGDEAQCVAAVPVMQEAADKGFLLGDIGLYFAYNNGVCVEKDIQRAMLHSKKVADDGVSLGQYALASIYTGENKAYQNYAQAVVLLQKATAQHNIDAAVWLAKLFLEGKGVATNYKKAAELLQIPLERKDASALFLQGIMYLEGKGVERSLVEAEKFFLQAAEQDFIPAYGLLGAIAERGAEGQPDPIKAYMWYSMVVGPETSYAQERMAAIRKDHPEAERQGEIQVELWRELHSPKYTRILQRLFGE